MAEPSDFDAELLARTGWMRALAARLAADAQAAEDLAQEAWLAARLHGRPAGALTPFLARILRNLSARARRHARHRRERELRVARAEAGPSTSDVVLLAARQRQLAAAVLSLDEPYRTILLLRYMEELPPRAIAARQGVPVRTVQTQLARGLAELRARLGTDPRRRAEWLASFALLARRSAGVSLWPIAMKKILAVCALLAVALWIVAVRQRERGGPVDADPAVAALLVRGSNEAGEEPAPAGTRALLASAESMPVVASEHDLCGLVVTPLGEPIAGAEVEVSLPLLRQTPGFQERDLASLPLAHQTTGVDGRFSFRLELHTAHDLEAHAPGFAHTRIANVHAGEERRLVLTRAAALVGRVTDRTSGAPLADARVELAFGVLELRGGDRREARSSSAGEFRIDDLPTLPCRLQIHSPDHVGEWPRQIELREGRETRVDFALSRGAILRGTVRDGRTQEPIAGARLELDSGPSTTSAADGSYQLSGVDLGRLSLRASGYGRYDHALRSQHLGPEIEGRMLEQDFFLLPSRSARGRVVDRAGAPIAGARVRAGGQRLIAGDSHGDGVLATTDSDGAFTLQDLRVDVRHTLFLQARGFATGVFDFPAREWDEQELALGELVLERPGTIAGEARDRAGRPMVGYCIQLWGEPARRDVLGPSEGSDEGYVDGFDGCMEAYVDAQGRYAFTGLPAGQYHLFGGFHGRLGGAELELVLAEGETLTDVDLVFPPELSIDGIVLDGERRPLPGATVFAWATAAPEEGGFRHPILDAICDEDGRFSLVGLEPGPYTLGVHAGASRWSARESFDHEVEFPDVLNGTRNLELVLPRPVMTSGIVHEADGRPAVGVSVCRFSDALGLGPCTRTDAQGRFEVYLAEGATIALYFVRQADLALGTERGLRMETSAGAQGLDVRLPPRTP